MIERHVLAGINLVGILLDLMGGLYLAYDLLGGRKGPLRTITRCATYSVLFGLGYGLPLGLTFGLVAGTGLGLALDLEFRSAGPSVRPFPYRTFAFGLFRGLALGLAAWLTFDLRFSAAFGLLSGFGLILIYMLRFAPSDEYQALAKPQLTSRKLLGTFLRGGVIGIAGILAGTLTREGLRGPLFGLEVGLVVAAAGGSWQHSALLSSGGRTAYRSGGWGSSGRLWFLRASRCSPCNTGLSCSTFPSDRKSRLRKAMDARQGCPPRVPARFRLS